MGTAVRLLALAAAVALAAAPTVATGQNLSLYGAIAYSASTGDDGFSTNYSTKGLADGEALRQCNQRGPGCTVVVSFVDGCGALAKGRDGGWGVAAGASADKAIADALAACAQFTVACEVTRWQCTG